MSVALNLLSYKDVKFVVCPFCHQAHIHGKDVVEADAACLKGSYKIEGNFDFNIASRMLATRDKINARHRMIAAGVEVPKTPVGRPKGPEDFKRRPKRDLKALAEEKAKEIVRETPKEDVSFAVTF